MSETTECLSGCSIRGQHLTDCDWGDCKGCLPRPAEFGLLCAWCWQRLNSDVIDCPELVRHLRVLAEPTAGTKPPSDGRGTLDPSEGDVLSGAVDAADELHAGLASWALLILEEHPNGEQMEGPDLRGAWVTRYGTTVGVREAEATARLVKWLLPLLPWCSAQMWAEEMKREIGDIVGTTKARWPVADERDRPSDIPCPTCERASLVYSPTSAYRLPFRVACTRPACGRMLTEDEWDALTGLAAA